MSKESIIRMIKELGKEGIIRNAIISLLGVALLGVAFFSYQAILDHRSKASVKTYNDIADTAANSTIQKDNITDSTANNEFESSIDAPLASDPSGLQITSEDIYSTYVELMESFDIEKATKVVVNQEDEELKSLYQDTAVLLFFKQLKEQNQDNAISEKLRQGAIENPVNFLISALYINSYDRTPLIYTKTSLNPEFTILSNLKIEEIENTYSVAEAQKTYRATFELDGYKQECIFFKTTESYSIYTINDLSGENPPFLTIEKFESIRGGYIED